MKLKTSSKITCSITVKHQAHEYKINDVKKKLYPESLFNF